MITLIGFIILLAVYFKGDLDTPISMLNPENCFWERLQGALLLVTCCLFSLYLWWLPLLIKMLKKIQLPSSLTVDVQ